MTKTFRLNDLQLVLLSNAASRDNGNLLPLPKSCTQDTIRILILAGEQPVKLDATTLLALHDLPLKWSEQKYELHIA